ncbi:MAG: ribonuclease P protein component [Rhodobacteraceae bacterium]|nr:ribonuclease P protein component [Paracoccaceae bacterium]
MTPPEAPVQGQDGRGTETPPAVSVCLTLTKRADFLRAAQARRQGTPGFLLQARHRRPDEAAPDAIRIGFTCSKKLGNAVARNRAKRRLREIARLILPLHGRPGWDYVLVGRPKATATRDFADLKADLVRALERIHADKP